MSLLEKIGLALSVKRESVDDFVFGQSLESFTKRAGEATAVESNPTTTVIVGGATPTMSVVQNTKSEVVSKPRLLLTSELIKHYGEPGNPDNLTTITCPFDLIIAWNPSQKTKKLTVHKKVAKPLSSVFDSLLSTYGADEISRLKINNFGGLYNFRAQRRLEKKYEEAIKKKNYSLAYTYLSRHSWAIAIDLYPDKNGLGVKCPRAAFCAKEYAPMQEIFYRHGFIGYGHERGDDWMHWEIGVLL